MITPVTLAQQTAEVMGSIGHARMIHAAWRLDLQHGYANRLACLWYIAILPRHAGRRSDRASNKDPNGSFAVCASPAADAQAIWETGFSLWASFMSHSNLSNQATGYFEGGLAVSYERVIISSETLRAWAAIPKPVSFTNNNLAVEPILATPPGGQFRGSPHIMSRYDNAFRRPLPTDWPNLENLRNAGAKDASARAAEVWARILSSADVAAPKNEIGA